MADWGCIGRRILAGAMLGLLALAAAGCGGAAATGPSGATAGVSGPDPAPQPLAAQETAPAAVVPDLLGLHEAQAVKALQAAGLVAHLRFERKAPQTGEVLRTRPAAGAELAAGSVVFVSIAEPPRHPPSRQEHEDDLHALGGLVEAHPDVFVGLYRDDEAIINVVFAPGAEPSDWHARLDAAAAHITYPLPGSGYRIDTCPHDRRTLREIQRRIRKHDLALIAARTGFAFFADAETCTVRIESTGVDAEEMAAVVERYGTAVSFDTTFYGYAVARAAAVPSR